MNEWMNELMNEEDVEQEIEAIERRKDKKTKSRRINFNSHYTVQFYSRKSVI